MPPGVLRRYLPSSATGGARMSEGSTQSIAGVKVHVSRAGKGSPLLVLHHDIGAPDKAEIFDLLAKSHDLIIPHHPGWGKSERPQWMRSVRDISAMYQALLVELKIDKASLLGLGFGGWIAAEMATQSPKSVDKMVLVGPMGIKPPEGYILDQAIVSYIDYARAGFQDQSKFDAQYGKEPTTDQLEAWDIAREMCFRTAWKPYMYSQTLPHLLTSVKTPTLIVWGDQDKIVPYSTAAAWQKALPAAKLETIKGCGHCVDLEQPEAVAKSVTAFLG